MQAAFVPTGEVITHWLIEALPEGPEAPERAWQLAWVLARRP
jgi:hypothetical protein